MTALFALVVLFGNPAKPAATPAPPRIVEHLEFEEPRVIRSGTHRPAGQSVEVRRGEEFAKEIPERRDFRKELRNSLESLHNSDT